MQLSWRRVARLKLEENLETSFRYISYLLILLYRLLAITCPCMVHDDIVEILFANSFPLDLEYSFLLKLLPLARKGTTGSYSISVCICIYYMYVCEYEFMSIATSYKCYTLHKLTIVLLLLTVPCPCHRFPVFCHVGLALCCLLTRAICSFTAARRGKTNTSNTATSEI